MLLTRIVREGRDDRGSGLVAVIALTLVTAIIGVTVGAVTVHSLQTTNGVAGSVEARAAALAGVAEAELLLRETDANGEDSCPLGAVLISTGVPAYEVAIFADDLANGWTEEPTCPAAESTRVKLVATGFADRATPGAGARGGKVVMEAIYQYVPVMTEIEVIDPAVYAYQIQGTLRNFELGVEPGTVIASDIQIRSGNFICTNGARVNGSVILAEGRAELVNCNVKGNVHVSQTIKLEGNQNGQFEALIEGNAIAAARTPTNTVISGNIVDLDKGTQVNGDVSAAGSVIIRGPQNTTVRGNVFAVGNSSTRADLENSTFVNGNVLSTGTVSTRGTVGGTRSSGVTGLQAPPVPVVPDWVNLPFSPDLPSIQASTWWERGFTNVVRWTGSCALSGSDPRWAALGDYTTRTIIDATACTNGVIVEPSLSPEVSLRTDVVFFANSFNFRKLPARAANMTDSRRMYFIVPDNNPDPKPSCEAPAGNITYNNEAQIGAPLALFFYSPCRILSDRNEMRGQIYGGTVEFRQQAQWTFVPATPPGIDFSAGTETEPVQTGSFLERRLSLRELSNGG